MADSRKFLDTVHVLGSKGYLLKDVYRRIQDRELFLNAYGKLYANQGAMTRGTDPQDTVEDMSIARIDAIIGKLNRGVYEWKPVRRTYIPKRKQGKRALGVPTWSDKLLQEVIRMVLTAYYEPQFSEHSHGFRENRGCHTALSEIHRTWKGTKWFIEGDFKGCFDNIDWSILLEILRRDIKDTRFLKLIRQMLQAGYMENWNLTKTYSGTPQGGVVSPVLSNIFLNEFDRFVESELLPAYNYGNRRVKNPEYGKVLYELEKARSNGDRAKVKELELYRRTIPSGDPNDSHYCRLRYVRYADDTLFGFTGTKAEALEIKQKLKEFSQSINLELSEEKTLITHATTGSARFLGYQIWITKDENKLTRGSRSLNMQPVLKVPKEVIHQWVGKYTKYGKPITRNNLLYCSDYEIIRTYDSELRGIVNYYSLADNVSLLYAVKHAAISSAVKTIAAKHRRRASWVYRQYLCKTNGLRHLLVQVENPKNPAKPYIATLGREPISVNKDAVIADSVTYFYNGTTELVRRLLADECELCGSSDNISVHHIRKLSDIRKRYQGRNDPPPWVQFMMARRRKTVVVCHSCHMEIHAGRYDNQRLKL